ncbi:MAG TPA: hemerythrin domain-containing protein [Burkholderiales bacterium]|nr:hemerythrin domain-containing protein [Burkholderiales bacterium]
MATGIAPLSLDLLDLLEAAHARIDTHLALLERLAERTAQHGSDGDARHAARFVMRFFDTTGLQHQRDEEEKLFPLLRAKAAELERPEVSAVMNEVEADHT